MRATNKVSFVDIWLAKVNVSYAYTSSVCLIQHCRLNVRIFEICEAAVPFTQLVVRPILNLHTVCLCLRLTSRIS